MLVFFLIFLEIVLSFKFKQKTTSSTGYYSTKAVQIMAQLKYLSNLLRTLEILLLICEINLILTWSVNCIISNDNANQVTTFPINERKLYVPLNAPNSYLDFLIEPNFQGVNKLFVLPFSGNDSRIGHLAYYLPRLQLFHKTL